jgi:hypothetical protein
MARRRQADGEKYIEADNGFGWTPDRSSVGGLSAYRYRTTIFGITYELERRGGTQEMFGWYLYTIKGSTHWFGEWCGNTLLPAVDEASALIAKTDLRGEGYEKEDG